MTVKDKEQAEGQEAVIFECNQGPATPGTAARCGICGREMATMEQSAIREGQCWLDAFGRSPNCYRIGFERLKAENASLLESLRVAEKESRTQALLCDRYRAAALTLERELKAALAAAEQRAEAAEKADSVKTREINILTREVRAAEKRSTDLTELLRDALAEFQWGGDGKAREFADRIRMALRGAALHDEERSAPPQEPK